MKQVFTRFLNWLPALSAALFLIAGCGQSGVTDPVGEVIADELMQGTDEPYEFVFKHLQKIDSTTFATEFARRIDVYGIQIDQNIARFEKYVKEGKKKNALKASEELKRGQKILGELEAMRQMMGDDTLRVAYYDYEFSGEARLSKGRKKVFEKGYATVTPEGRVLTLAGDPKDLHKATGLVIPGYQALLESFKEPEED
ncbi:MAG: hypothetical protein K6G79_06290 [Bacteroidales bacterium]|nr:hypothetical protein [Bacteroidales bacterium]